MKRLALALMLVISAATASASSSVSTLGANVQKRDLASGDYFDFQAYSACVGCVSFGDYYALQGFPNYPEGSVTRIRLYYSDMGFEFVTLSSPYVEMPLLFVPPGDLIIPAISMGNWASGQRFFFKVALVTEMGRLIFMTPTKHSDFFRHSVVIR